MRLKFDFDDEFEVVMRRRRRRIDDEDSVDVSKRFWFFLIDVDRDFVVVLNKVFI